MTIHTFQPTRYYTTMGSHEPALHIAPGDTVITTTVDAAGRDAGNEQVTPRGNPMTGPFFVDGAEPGDTLVVHLEKIKPNRTQGWGSAMLAPNVVDPAYVPELPWPPKGERSRSYWHVDVDAGTVTLEKPETKLGRFTLPIRPMIGCFGVAPAGGEAISTATSAAHGGNMDYRHFVEGKTVYFPVFVPGALFFLGDAPRHSGRWRDGRHRRRDLVRCPVPRRSAQGAAHLLAARRGRRLHLRHRQRPSAGSGHPARHHRAAALADGRIRTGCAGRPIPSWASASNTISATCSTRRTRWSASWPNVG